MLHALNLDDLFDFFLKQEVDMATLRAMDENQLRLLIRDRSDRLKIQEYLAQRANKSAGTDPLLLNVYRTIVSDIVKTGRVTPREETMLVDLRTQYRISNESHAETLKELKLTTEAFQRLKVSVDDTSTKASASGTDCVVCLAATATHVILDCMHLCLCADCAHYFNSDRTSSSARANSTTSTAASKSPATSSASAARTAQPVTSRCPMCNAAVVDVRKTFT